MQKTHCDIAWVPEWLVQAASPLAIGQDLLQSGYYLVLTGDNRPRRGSAVKTFGPFGSSGEAQFVGTSAQALGLASASPAQRRKASGRRAGTPLPG